MVPLTLGRVVDEGNFLINGLTLVNSTVVPALFLAVRLLLLLLDVVKLTIVVAFS